MSEVDKAKPAGTTVTVDRHDGGVPIGRIILIVAALVAAVAVGLAVWKQRQSDAPVAASGAPEGQQPNVEASIRDLETKLKANPNDKEGWRRLGWAHYTQANFGKAAEAYRRATQIDPNTADNWSALGEALTLAIPEGQQATVPPEAIAAFRKALTLDAADPRARYFLAVKKDLDGDHQGAIDDWIKLLRESPPGAPWIASVRQTVQQAAEKYDIDVAGKLPDPPPSATPADNAGSVATAGIPGPTQQQMREASSLPPGQQEAMVRGMVDSLANRLKANPQDADGWIRLMRARMVLGEQQAAGQALRDGLAAFPSDQAARTRITEGARTLGVPGA